MHGPMNVKNCKSFFTASSESTGINALP